MPYTQTNPIGGSMSKSLRLNVPKEVRGKKLERDYVTTAEAFVHEQTVLRLYRSGKVSTGIAAKMLGMPLADFMRFAGQHDVSIFPEYDKRGELETELRFGRRAVQPARSEKRKKP